MGRRADQTPEQRQIRSQHRVAETAQAERFHHGDRSRELNTFMRRLLKRRYPHVYPKTWWHGGKNEDWDDPLKEKGKGKGKDVVGGASEKATSGKATLLAKTSKVMQIGVANSDVAMTGEETLVSTKREDKKKVKEAKSDEKASRAINPITKIVMLAESAVSASTPPWNPPKDPAKMINAIQRVKADSGTAHGNGSSTSPTLSTTSGAAKKRRTREAAATKARKATLSTTSGAARRRRQREREAAAAAAAAGRGRKLRAPLSSHMIYNSGGSALEGEATDLSGSATYKGAGVKSDDEWADIDSDGPVPMKEGRKQALSVGEGKKVAGASGKNSGKAPSKEFLATGSDKRRAPASRLSSSSGPGGNNQKKAVLSETSGTAQKRKQKEAAAAAAARNASIPKPFASGGASPVQASGKVPVAPEAASHVQADNSRKRRSRNRAPQHVRRQARAQMAQSEMATQVLQDNEISSSEEDLPTSDEGLIDFGTVPEVTSGTRSISDNSQLPPLQGETIAKLTPQSFWQVPVTTGSLSLAWEEDHEPPHAPLGKASTHPNDEVLSTDLPATIVNSPSTLLDLTSPIIHATSITGEQSKVEGGELVLNESSIMSNEGLIGVSVQVPKYNAEITDADGLMGFPKSPEGDVREEKASFYAEEHFSWAGDVEDGGVDEEIGYKKGLVNEGCCVCGFPGSGLLICSC
ncbi:MAG: hypothetical protein MMC33_003209 [Icmadophila ericetorum]|nr:hypothetical protein [Icmadophila ericetorum]